MLTTIPKHWQRIEAGVYYDPLEKCIQVVIYELLDAWGWPRTPTYEAMIERIFPEILKKLCPNDQCVMGEEIQPPGPPAG